MVGHRPADCFAAASVEHEGEVEEAFPGRDIRYLGQPETIRESSEKAALYRVRGAGGKRSSRRAEKGVVVVKS
jgi:hypothetical protein